MSIASILEALKGAVGDGKLVSIHGFFLHHNSRFYATDGRMHASAPSGLLLGDWCVNATLLQKACSNADQITFTPTADTVVVKRGRSRVTLKQARINDFPIIVNAEAPPDVTQWNPLTPEFHAIVKALAPFRGESQTWLEALHWREDYVFAFSAAEFVRYDFNNGRSDMSFSIAPWLIDFLLKTTAPNRAFFGTNMTSFAWDNGMVVHAPNIVDDVPDNAESMVSNLSMLAGEEVPDGLVDAVRRIDDYGAKYFKFLPEGLHATVGDDVLEEEMELSLQPTTWSAEKMARILQYATHVNIDQFKFEWRGPQMRGALAGVSG